MRITKNIATLIVTTLIVFSSCKTTEVSYNVINIKDAAGVRNHAVMYFLPKTVVRTTVKLKRTIQKKGAFSNYAKKYLNIENAIQEDSEKWEIIDVNFKTYPIIDSTKLFLIEHEEKTENIDIQLSKCGILKSFNLNNKLFADNVLNNEINDVSRKVNENTINRILTIQDEINFDEVSVPKQVANSRALSEKAKILAEKILTLREDKAATIVGDGYTKNLPNGAALSIMIESMNKLEKQYLSLFKGKNKKEEYTYNFDFIPEEARDVTQKIIFRFSQQKGIVAINNMSGMPVIIELNASGNFKQVASFNKRQDHLKRVAKIEETKKGLHYIMPDIVKVKLLMDDNYLAEKDILLPQFGVVQYLPPKYLNGNYSIEMNSELGSIKSIKKITKIQKDE